ncbi:uncharacterized protein LOC115713596 isoform X3 [Cannabis sativa]|uniref:uncharacterized protein LOC115713596 isoform X3 n=1 Tax=Cannabis sativa TaxID=3483 RepID=UPI0011DF475B|nr:uncharacterized protein LOC115713596 isoform X3 [Cannabis sativa]
MMKIDTKVRNPSHNTLTGISDLLSFLSMCLSLCIFLVSHSLTLFLSLHEHGLLRFGAEAFRSCTLGFEFLVSLNLEICDQYYESTICNYDGNEVQRKGLLYFRKELCRTLCSSAEPSNCKAQLCNKGKNN